MLWKVIWRFGFGIAGARVPFLLYARVPQPDGLETTEKTSKSGQGVQGRFVLVFFSGWYFFFVVF